MSSSKHLVSEKKEIKYLVRNLICSLFPKKKMILLESHPDLSCNTYELFRYMIDNHVNDRFTLVWMVSDPEKYIIKNKYKNVLYKELEPEGFFNKLKHYIFCNRAAAIVTSNRVFFPRKCGNRTQLNIYLDHGSPLKDVRTNGKRFYIDCDYIVSQSEFFNKLLTEQYTVEERQIIVEGLPRNDQLFREYDSINRIYSDADSFRKIIIWAPTFRHHKRKERIDCDFNFPLGIPIFYSAKSLETFNAFLEKNNVLMILKPHPAQDMDVIIDLKLSNIRILVNSQMEKADVQLNELLAQTDALVSDYSSIYYDYLLLDRPIAITLDDYTAYGEQMGFVFENTLDVLAGAHVYSEKDMYGFVQQVINDEDPFRKDREAIKKKVDCYCDDKSSYRVTEFILAELESRSKVKGRL